MSSVFLDHSLPYTLSQGLSLNPEFAHSASQANRLAVEKSLSSFAVLGSQVSCCAHPAVTVVLKHELLSPYVLYISLSSPPAVFVYICFLGSLSLNVGYCLCT